MIQFVVYPYMRSGVVAMRIPRRSTPEDRQVLDGWKTLRRIVELTLSRAGHGKAKFELSGRVKKGGWFIDDWPSIVLIVRFMGRKGSQEKPIMLYAYATEISQALRPVFGDEVDRLVQVDKQTSGLQIWVPMDAPKMAQLQALYGIR